MNNTLGKRISILRKQINKTQSQLGVLLNTSQDTISMWERDKSKPGIDDLILLSAIFNETTDYILGVEDESGNRSMSNFNNSFNNNTNSNIKVGK